MKRFLLAMIFAAAATGAQASYLYWQVTGSETTEATYTHATVWATQGTFGSPEDTQGTALSSQQYNPNTGNFETFDNPVANSQYDTYVIDVSSYASGNYSFYIELKNYDTATAVYKTVGYLTGGTYASMVQSNYIDTGLSLTPAAVWHGGSFSATPEPTSAMLLLLGLSGLALRRRRA